MAPGINRGAEAQNEDHVHEDEALPAASEDRVLDETARLAREGQRQLAADPKEPKEPKPGLDSGA